MVGIDFNEGQQLPIRGPGIRNLGVLAGGQPLQPATAVGQLPEKVRRPFLGRLNAIRLPSGVQAGLLFAFPSNVNRVNVSRERSYSQIWLLLRDPDGYSPSVGGKPRRLVGVRRGGQGLLCPIATDPHQPALGALNAPGT